MKNTKKTLNQGFSLVEMLVVIAVIGIIAAIAVPNIGRINDSAQDAKNRRNAQSLASTFSAAQAAGAPFSGDTLETVIQNLEDGVTVTATGPFSGTLFRVPNLSDADVAGASEFLLWNADLDILTYIGTQTSSSSSDDTDADTDAG